MNKRPSWREILFEFIVVLSLIAMLSWLLLSIIKPAHGQTRPVFVERCGELPDYQGNVPADVTIVCPRLYLPHVSS